jgi:outer membrane protein assembly factor BamB
MSDDELQGLEKAARDAPTDLNAGRAYADALARTGDRRGHHLELARLVKLGDPKERDELDRWSPWPTSAGVLGTRRSFAKSLVGSPRGKRATVAAASPRILGATRDAVLLAVEGDTGKGAVICLDAQELGSRWSAPCRSEKALFALRGDDLVSAFDKEVVLHDARTGEVVAKAALPGRALDLALEGDRAAVLVGGPRRAVVGLDAGWSFGEVRWRHEVEGAGAPFLRVASGRVHASAWGRSSIDVFDLETGAPQPPLDLGSEDKLAVLHGGDGRGLLVSTWRGEKPALEERGAATWRHETLFPRGAIAIAPSAVVGVARDESGGPGFVLLAMDRDKGHVTWLQELGGRAPGISPRYRVAIAGDVVYVGTAGAKISVTAYELATGDTIFERAFPLPVDGVPLDASPEVHPAAFDMAPLDDKIVLVVGSDGETVVALLSP